MEINPQTLEHRSVYKLMTGAILPRPIGWISSLNADGVPNLAPYSFFNAVGSNPPHLLFCPTYRGMDGDQKDTLTNVRATGEFVVNIVTEATAEAMNVTSGEYPSNVSEFAEAGLTSEPSVVVKVPRVAESPVHFECEVDQIIQLGDMAGSGIIVVGRIVHIHVDDAILIGEDKIDVTRLKPIGRLAGGGYTRVTDLFEMERPQIKRS